MKALVEWKYFPSRSEWLKNRRRGIGGSDIAAVIGQNPFMSNTELFDIKTGRKEQADISENPRVAYGVSAEELLVKLFELDHPEKQAEHLGFNSVYNDKYPWALASLDGRTVEVKSLRDGVLEIKTTEIMRSEDWEKWNGQLPQNYYCQVLFYLAVTEFDYADLRAAIKYTSAEGDKRTTIRDYHIERSEVEGDIAYLMEQGAKFWEKVEKGISPSRILPDI